MIIDNPLFSMRTILTDQTIFTAALTSFSYQTTLHFPELIIISTLNIHFIDFEYKMFRQAFNNISLATILS